jgi:hypothetical protein
MPINTLGFDSTGLKLISVSQSLPASTGLLPLAQTMTGKKKTTKVSTPKVSRSFNISPSVSGKSTWNLDVDGPLTLTSSGTWTITPIGNFSASIKTWGAGGSTGPGGASPGAGGYATGVVSLTGSSSYTVYVGSKSGGGSGYGNGGNGGSYSGIRTALGNGVIIAGGAGGGGYGSGYAPSGGAGGGSSGENAYSTYDNPVAQGGSQSSGGGGGQYGANGGDGSQWTGGVAFTSGGGGGGGGSGYYGGGAGSGFGGGAGAGGSGYYDPTIVKSATLTAGTQGTPGNSGDASRGSSGNTDTDGSIIIS